MNKTTTVKSVKEIVNELNSIHGWICKKETAYFYNEDINDDIFMRIDKEYSLIMYDITEMKQKYNYEFQSVCMSDYGYMVARFTNKHLNS